MNESTDFETGEAMEFIGLQALMNIFIHFSVIVLTFLALRAVNFNKILKSHRVWESQLLYILLSIAIGYLVSQFVIELITASRNLIYLF